MPATDRAEAAALPVAEYRRLEADRPALEAHRTELLRTQLDGILASDGFYREKYRGLDLEPGSFELADLQHLPFTTKDELVRDQQQHPPFGSNLTRPLAEYVRAHQTSGTSGRPLRWLDTAASWAAFLDCWERVLAAVALRRSDRVFVAFSFGPFIGFWGAFEAAQRLGALTLTGGGLSSEQRLDQLNELEATVLVCTPTYALHLAEVAARRGLDLAGGTVRATVCAGEPGASVPAVKRRIESAWGAPCYDHAGATELGAWGYPGPDGKLFLFEPLFLPELLDSTSGHPLELRPEGTRGELVLTNLGRPGSPLLRYRTGDLVELVPGEPEDPRWYLRGGVLARVDDMFVVRGVNVYPSAVENLIRQHPEIGEFRVTVDRRAELSELSLEIEVTAGDAASVAASLRESFHRSLSLRIPVSLCDPGSLPRFELKARRFRFADRD